MNGRSNWVQGKFSKINYEFLLLNDWIKKIKTKLLIYTSSVNFALDPFWPHWLLQAKQIDH